MDLAILRHWRARRFQEYPDAVLCAECLAGNEDAWAALLARYQNLIYSIPLKFHLNEDEAAEIFQAVAMDLFAGLERLRERDKLKSWLISVVRHRCIRYKEKRQIEPLSWEELEQGATDVADDRLHAEQWMVELDEESTVREAVAGLPARCRDLIHWLFYSDEPPSYESVAGRLGVAKNSIGFIRDRCLQKLRRNLQDQGFGAKTEAKAKVATEPEK
jgi:RNA polymerase sigma factor (sigma-70 family)